MYRPHFHSTRARVLALAIAAGTVATLTCSLSPTGTSSTGTGTAGLEATKNALVAQLTELAQGGGAAKPAATQPPAATASSAGSVTSGSTFTDDFAKDRGDWTVFDGVTLGDGQLLTGPFKDCADIDVTISPQCFSVCTKCGVLTEIGRAHV
jgi:hypothetical protein